MTEPALPPVTFLIEITSLNPATPAAALASALAGSELPIRTIGELHTHPAVIIEAAEPVHEQLQAALGPGVEITELRRHFHLTDLPPDRLTALINDSSHHGRLAIGAAAVERAAQRRRLELLIIAADLAADYAKTIDTIVAGTAYHGPLLKAPLTRAQLGHACGVKRAGCVGLLRGARRVAP